MVLEVLLEFDEVQGNVLHGGHGEFAPVVLVVPLAGVVAADPLDVDDSLVILGVHFQFKKLEVEGDHLLLPGFLHQIHCIHSHPCLLSEHLDLLQRLLLLGDPHDISHRLQLLPVPGCLVLYLILLPELVLHQQELHAQDQQQILLFHLFFPEKTGELGTVPGQNLVDLHILLHEEFVEVLHGVLRDRGVIGLPPHALPCNADRGFS